MSIARIVLVGGGGHASDVLHAIEALNAERIRYEVVGILDDAEIDERRFRGRGIAQLGGVDDIDGIDAQYVVAIGWPWRRHAVVDRIGGRGEPAEPIVHPSADIGYGTELGRGTVVLGGAHTSPMTMLGEHSLVSYLAAVGHDTAFGAFGTVMPGALVSGDVRGGDRVLVGTGAVVREGLTIGDDARIAAGAVVVEPVASGVTVTGVPGRPRAAGDPSIT